MAYEDKQLECKECGKVFTWKADEQAFFAQKGFKNVPARCLDCREKARERRKDSQVATSVECVDCHKKGDVPFEPTGKPIYCEDCFEKLRQNSENQSLDSQTKKEL